MRWFYETELKNDLIDVLCAVNHSTGVKRPKCFFSIKAYPFIKENALDQKLDINYISHCKVFYDNCNAKFDYGKEMFDYDSVVFTAISLAVYMGFSEIYLLGCDATGIQGVIESRKGQADHCHAYQTDAANEKLQQISQNLIPMEIHFKGWYQIFHLYNEFHRYCSSRKIKLVNCTENTLVDSIPWQSLNSVL